MTPFPSQVRTTTLLDSQDAFRGNARCVACCPLFAAATDRRGRDLLRRAAAEEGVEDAADAATWRRADQPDVEACREDAAAWRRRQQRPCQTSDRIGALDAAALNVSALKKKTGSLLVEGLPVLAGYVVRIGYNVVGTNWPDCCLSTLHPLRVWRIARRDVTEGCAGG